MEQQYLTLAEHKEYAQRMEAEHRRQNQRLRELEENAKQITDLMIAMHDLTSSMQRVDQKLTRFDGRLESLEGVPAKRWDKLISGIIGAAAGVIGSGLVSAIINYM